MVAMFENFVSVTQEEDVPQVIRLKFLPHQPSPKEVPHKLSIGIQKGHMILVPNGLARLYWSGWIQMKKKNTQNDLSGRAIFLQLYQFESVTVKWGGGGVQGAQSSHPSDSLIQRWETWGQSFKPIFGHSQLDGLDHQLNSSKSPHGAGHFLPHPLFNLGLEPVDPR